MGFGVFTVGYGYGLQLGRIGSATKVALKQRSGCQEASHVAIWGQDCCWQKEEPVQTVVILFSQCYEYLHLSGQLFQVIPHFSPSCSTFLRITGLPGIHSISFPNLVIPGKIPAISHLSQEASNPLLEISLPTSPCCPSSLHSCVLSETQPCGFHSSYQDTEVGTVCYL